MTNNLAIYIHWPFCKAKCPYCDFNSHVSEKIDQARWKDAYLKELGFYHEKHGKKQVSSIFFGGGTPSLMEPALVEKVIDFITKNWKVANDIEITLEANPTSFETKKFVGFKNAGVNRVSIGLQSLRDDNLKFLGREHSAKEAAESIVQAGNIFDNYSFDMIYALPGHTVQAWKEELGEALKMARHHISLYQLTIEKGTPFFKAHADGEFVLPDEDTAAELYNVTNEMAGKAGFDTYEVSNYARAGFESKHNLNYWKHGEYVGIGPGAHGRLNNNIGTREATTNIYNPKNWLTSVEDKSTGLQSKEPIEGERLLEEFLIMNLRLKEGFSRQKFIDLFAATPEEKLNLDKMIKGGFVEVGEDYIRATKKGFLVLNSVISKLIL